MLPMTCKNESVILVTSKSRSLRDVKAYFFVQKIGGGIKNEVLSELWVRIKG